MEKHNNKFISHLNKVKVESVGHNVINFSKPVPITSDKTMYNGARYDIESMDVSKYKGLVTVNHSDNVQDIVGKVIGLTKNKHDVTISGIEFAVEHSGLALFVKNMFTDGYITDFSIETVGPWADDDGVYKNSELIGLSIVLVGNNKEATVSEIYTKVLNSARENGVSTASLEKLGIDNVVATTDNSDMSNKIQNDADTPAEVTQPVTPASEVKETPVKPVATETPEVVETPETVEPTEEVVEGEETPKVVKAKEDDKELSEKLDNALKEINKLKEDLFTSSVTEPTFVKTVKENKMDYRERHAIQINSAWELLKNRNYKAGEKLDEMNKINLEALQGAGLVTNTMTIGDMGNFVLSPELLTDIGGFRSNYQTFLSTLNWQDTMNLQMAWLQRDGDINMQEVEMCDDDADGNLKPLSEYGATIQTSNLKEVAAVTPVCDAATRFLAVDLLGDVAQGYRTDYDRKRAQLAIARMQQAINASGQSQVYSTVSGASALGSFIATWSSVSEEIENGVFYMTHRSYAELLRELITNGISTDSAIGLFTTGNQPSILGRNIVLVPNDLMPTLNTAETRTFVVEGANVTINHAVMYVDPTTFVGRTSGGLKYDLSSDASYEDNGTVKSAFQRNELVLRGSFFRGAAIKDTSRVVGLKAAGLS